jgi:hypothetical protein
MTATPSTRDPVVASLRRPLANREPAMTDEQLCERAVDQLVDEVLERLNALDAILPHSCQEPSPPRRSADARIGAHHVVGLLRSSQRCTVAARVVDAVWSPTPPERIPPTWWRTPLGQLLTSSLGDNGPAPRKPPA